MRKIEKINYTIILIAASLITYLDKNFRLDDGLIYYRYIENFINGNGLVYNIGEKFNAITSPFYVFISVLVSSLTREVEITQLILNGAFITLAGITLAYLFYFIDQPRIAFIASMTFVTSKFFYITFGLETNLFIFLSILCIILFFKKSYTLLSINSALLILTRGEGLFLVLILWGFIVYENIKSIKIRYFLVIGIIIFVNLLFNYFYYGYFMPQTLSVKMEHGKSGLWGGGYGFLFDFNFMHRIAFNNQPFYELSLLVLAFVGIANHLKEKTALILFLYCIGITVFHVALNIQNYHWYYAVHMLALIIFASYGVNDIINYLNSRVRQKVLRISLMVIIFIFPSLTQIELFRLLYKEKPIEGYVAAGEWLKSNTSDTSKIACMEIGHIGWYSKRKIIDMVGLVNPKIAEHLGQKKYDAWFELYNPDYVLVHDPPLIIEKTVQKYVDAGYYEPEKKFIYKGLEILKRTPKD